MFFKSKQVQRLEEKNEYLKNQIDIMNSSFKKEFKLINNKLSCIENPNGYLIIEKTLLRENCRFSGLERIYCDQVFYIFINSNNEEEKILLLIGREGQNLGTIVDYLITLNEDGISGQIHFILDTQDFYAIPKEEQSNVFNYLIDKKDKQAICIEKGLLHEIN